VSEAISPVRGGTSPLRLGLARGASRGLLAGVGLVLVLVTIPLLRSLALHENERDALRALDLLAPAVLSPGASERPFPELLGADGELARRLPDTRLLDGGRVLFHHGYLFEVVAGTAGERQLRAWPLRHGETGLGVFWSPRPGEVLGHPNRGALWSGLESAPPVPPGDDTVLLSSAPRGWRPLPAALALR
jgi:hypothetical protein